MRLHLGDVNVYWQHATLTPHNVRIGSYGRPDNGNLVPEVGDVIRDFPGYMGAPITVEVKSVEPIGQGCTAYVVTVDTVTA